MSSTVLSYTSQVIQTIEVDVTPHVLVLLNGTSITTSLESNTHTEEIVVPTAAIATDSTTTTDAAKTFSNVEDITWTVGDATLTYPSTYVQYLSFAGAPATSDDGKTCAQQAHATEVQLPPSTDQASFIFPINNATASTILPSALLDYLYGLATVSSQFYGQPLTACAPLSETTLPAYTHTLSPTSYFTLPTTGPESTTSRRFEGPRSRDHPGPIATFAPGARNGTSEIGQRPDRMGYGTGARGTGEGAAVSTSTTPAEYSGPIPSPVASLEATNVHTTAFVIAPITGRAIVTSETSSIKSMTAEPVIVKPDPDTHNGGDDSDSSQPPGSEKGNPSPGEDDSSGHNDAPGSKDPAGDDHSSGQGPTSGKKGKSSNNGESSANEHSSGKDDSSGNSDFPGSKDSDNDQSSGSGSSPGKGTPSNDSGSSDNSDSSNRNNHSGYNDSSPDDYSGHDQSSKTGQSTDQSGSSGNSGSSSNSDSSSNSHNHSGGSSGNDETTDNASTSGSGQSSGQGASSSNSKSSSGNSNSAGKGGSAKSAGQDSSDASNDNQNADTSSSAGSSGADNNKDNNNSEMQDSSDGLNSSGDSAQALVTTDGLTFTAVRSGEAVVLKDASSTARVPVGSAVTFEGQTVSAVYGGGAVAVNGEQHSLSAPQTQATRTGAPAAVVTAAGHTLSVAKAGSSAIVLLDAFSTMTLQDSGTATFEDQSVSVASDGSFVVVGTQTVGVESAKTTGLQAVYADQDHTIMAMQAGDAVVLKGGLSSITVQDGSTTTFEGQAISVAADGHSVVVDGSSTLTLTGGMATNSAGLGDYIKSGIGGQDGTTSTGTSSPATSSSSAGSGSSASSSFVGYTSGSERVAVTWMGVMAGVSLFAFACTA